MVSVDEHSNNKEIKLHGHLKTETLLRDTSANYIRLICNADRKARNMLVVNSILLAISVTLLTESLSKMPYIWISALILLVTNLAALFFILQSARPDFPFFKNPELENNMTHYRKCGKLSYVEYKKQMKETLADDDKKLEVVISDMYYYGNLLNIKYRLIRWAYRIFSWGMILSIASYLIILLFVLRNHF
ncbi:MAG TPA: DUF5706 domain-containing protein [Chitinophagaceae bacterium]|nr:DUF5706 domain-containing protein [Chitinophagaceae bacterium]